MNHQPTLLQELHTCQAFCLLSQLVHFIRRILDDNLLLFLLLGWIKGGKLLYMEKLVNKHVVITKK